MFHLYSSLSAVIFGGNLCCLKPRNQFSPNPSVSTTTYQGKKIICSLLSLRSCAYQRTRVAKLFWMRSTDHIDQRRSFTPYGSTLILPLKITHLHFEIDVLLYSVLNHVAGAYNVAFFLFHPNMSIGAVTRQTPSLKENEALRASCQLSWNLLGSIRSQKLCMY